MQKDIHPKKQVVKFIMPDGSVLETSSTYSKSDVFHCEASIKEHPAWNSKKVIEVNTKSAQVTNFNNRFNGLDFNFSKK